MRGGDAFVGGLADAAAAPAAARTRTARVVGLVGLLATQLVGGWGVGWDIRWHIVIGRDSFWIAPHLMIYASVAAAAVLSLGVLARESVLAARGAGLPGTLTVGGLTGTRGFHLAWWGILLTLLAAPIDDLWHRLFGLDVSLWSPPHLLGLAGAQVNALACLVIAREVWPDGGWRRTAALLFGGIMLLDGFYVGVSESFALAFTRGGIFFFGYAILGALAFTFALVLTAALGGGRLAPLVVVVGALAMQLTTLAIADLGFAILDPPPALEDAIRENPTSPVAIAHEIARRTGTAPGRMLSSRIFPLLPAALALLVDMRRRPRASAVAFGVALALVSLVMLSRSPAFAHAIPTMGEAAIALGLSALAGLAAGAGAARLGRVLASV